MEPEQIAEVCHEANRAFCRTHGDMSHKPWAETAWSTKQSAIAGVVFLIENPEANLSSLHESWRQRKNLEGWVLGAEKSEDAKTHPCLIPYDELPVLQKKKDALFRAVVKTFTSGDDNG